ncbi:ATP-dependent endonuclease [Pedobacter sp. MC2016-15]|uniref:ATP-dependent nuclease n=1 Tax=Pedobacter sp. MC2016-15 TaxID=2994473 RepID=UPI0022469D45|nr:ATP-dependent endonuclease [Pedobacter sp. MC2016-15]MCX2480781.1 ATP-dependent endonuclease [Pedobacter sp. MC2016-15]
MNIKKVKINNFRLLKDFELDLEDNLSLIIGKNNCGKTSLLTLLNKFLNEKSTSARFHCDDFNIDFQKELKTMTDGEADFPEKSLGITMKLFINYDDTDDLSQVSNLIMDLNPENKVIVLAFEYSLTPDLFYNFRTDFKEFKREYSLKVKEDASIQIKEGKLKTALSAQLIASKIEKSFYNFFKKYHQDYFSLSKKTLFYSLELSREIDDNYIDLIKENIKLDKIINFKIIQAKRDVSNRESDKTLSVLSSEYYSIKENQNKDSLPIKQFKDTLEATDEHLDTVYVDLFKDIIDTVEQFGGTKAGDSVIKIISTLQHRELLKGNTTVMYDHNNDHALPESYNGLGYMNLIGIIFQIEVLLSDFRKDNKDNEKPAVLNILFIEEPEAHTHPQMQYVFIKNIKDILTRASSGKTGKIPFSLQTIITTHSSHITAESEFDDLKYFAKISENTVVAKNLKDLRIEYGQETEQYDFLRQYLTINRTELFFADKAIFIEGDTERLLLSTIMRKLDLEHKEDGVMPLLSQNISIVEVGAHSQIFEKLIIFLDIKTLIITDIDTYKMVQLTDSSGNLKVKKNNDPRMVPAKCPVNDATDYGNNAIKLFTGSMLLASLKKLNVGDTIFKKTGSKWNVAPDGNLCLAFQLKEEEYHARSYEDAFISLNLDFIKNNIKKFQSLKNVEDIDDLDPYDIADKCIAKKTSFALDILYVSDEKYSNWRIPSYIKGGLLWLKK